jgi:hypothetical protein
VEACANTPLNQQNFAVRACYTPPSVNREGTEKRTSDGDAGYFLRPFMLCCVPVRQAPKSTEKWSRRYGPAEFHVAPDPKLGSPAGQDRLILLLAARAAIQQKRREVTLGTASSILKSLGFPPDGRNYQRLAGRFQRVIGTAMTCAYWQKVDGLATVVRTAEINFEESRLWFQERGANTAPARFENTLTVSQGFWDEIQRNPAFVDMAILRGLANSPGTLAFYLWLALCAHTTWPDHVRQIPLHGPLGLKTRLGIAGYSQERDFARAVRRWVDNLRSVWQECPATISEDGAALNVRDLPIFPLANAR